MITKTVINNMTMIIIQNEKAIEISGHSEKIEGLGYRVIGGRQKYSEYGIVYEISCPPRLLASDPGWQV
jgi:hypothetical protein